MPSPEYWSKMLDHLRRSQDDLNERIRRFADGNPTVADALEELHEAHRESVNYLCHFEYAMSERSGKVDPCEIIATIHGTMQGNLERLTGREYVPKIVRINERRERDKPP